MGASAKVSTEKMTAGSDVKLPLMNISNLVVSQTNQLFGGHVGAPVLGCHDGMKWDVLHAVPQAYGGIMIPI